MGNCSQKNTKEDLSGILILYCMTCHSSHNYCVIWPCAIKCVCSWASRPLELVYLKLLVIVDWMQVYLTVLLLLWSFLLWKELCFPLTLFFKWKANFFWNWLPPPPARTPHSLLNYGAMSFHSSAQLNPPPKFAHPASTCCCKQHEMCHF